MIDHVSSPAVVNRDDVVLHDGLLALSNDTLTPREAVRDDLLFLRGVLDDAGIRFLLVRGDGETPVLAVDWKDRKALGFALVAACQNEPFYVKPARIKENGKPFASDARDSPVLVADGVLVSAIKAKAMMLFRPRVEPAGRLRFDAPFGVRLELWEYVRDEVVAPNPNALMRRWVPRTEAIDDTVDFYGQSWPTLSGMFEPLASDIQFDIDIVFSWVDGAELEWQKARAARMANFVVGEGDDSEARFRQLDELKYALRSVHLFAPWIRNIYIATDSPRPAWLAEHPRVTLMRSEDFFANHDDLPTHNSHAVESQLHNIPGLSEHFLYSNDDMFFGRSVSPAAFFTPGGVSKFIEARTRIGLGESSIERSGFENAARVNRRLLQQKFGATITRHLEHAATPLRISVMKELEKEFPEDFKRTSASAFRQATDVSVTNSLYHYYALLSGKAMIQADAKVKYVDTTSLGGLRKMRSLLRKRTSDFFCLNDGSFPEVSAEDRAAAVRTFLDEYYPIAAPWELPEAE
ncbi:stealth family protein [Rhodoglobus aureus]|uniref:Stealth family protein n=1 Tax=Rhodoglobus aureus TaxID=191497 RepID=A0ABN1VVZ3_9MICO